ncbi:hypothetical protein IFM89_027876 [Coptis chinensis]|uniref:Uncharacterized protein n=1 Tax=Coptis chinensis TaxID=261450 RepID=A0A835HHW0_9MAGN|nr:hypothetical protein IFM89_027876 [Coptis chinensis]
MRIMGKGQVWNNGRARDPPLLRCARACLLLFFARRACCYLFRWFTFSLVLKQDLELDDFIYGPRELLIKFVEENYPLLPKPDSLPVDDLKLDSLVVGRRGLGMLKSETARRIVKETARKNEYHRRSLAASLVQGVYVLERDRQENRQGPHALAS